MEMTLARVVHVLGVVLWIGGVAMVTTVILPAVRQMRAPREQLELFEQIEGRFAWQARATTLLTGLSGFYLLDALDAWARLASPAFWWVHAMVLVWALFTLMLFVFEPLVLRRWFAAQADRDPAKVLGRIQALHWLALLLSLLTIAGAVAGSHGARWF